MARNAEPLTDDDLGPLMGAKEASEQDKIAAAVAFAMASMKEQLLKEIVDLQRHGAEVAPDERNWVKDLAMEISQVNDQGSGRKRVAPDVLKARAEARKRMHELIDASPRAGSPGAARYRIVAKTYLANQLVVPFWIARDHSVRDTEIDWDDVPNDSMRPMNEPAEAIYNAFMDSIGTPTWKAPEENRVGMTPKGLVVHGRAVPAKREVTSGQTGYEPGGFTGIKIHHKSETGQMVKTHVLGSIVPPAERRV